MNEIIRGSLINPLHPDRLQVLPHVEIRIEKGRITAVSEIDEEVPRQLILPGLIDLHTHMAQYPNIGLGQNTLLDWLDQVTYPTEAKLSDVDIANHVANRFVSALIRFGTSTAVVFPSSQNTSVEAVFQAAEQAGIRLISGIVAMDRNAPESLCRDRFEIVDATDRFAERWHGAGDGRLQMSVLPRYALSCSPELMRDLADRARLRNWVIQTHLAENPNEIKAIATAFPNHASYTDIYADMGLVTRKSMFAHGIFLSDRDVQTLADAGSTIVHCPSSNRFLTSGVFPFRNRIDAGVRVGIGTDVSGGYSLSMLMEIREALETAKTRHLLSPGEATDISLANVLYAATLGAADAIDMADQIGSIEVGKAADLLVIHDDEDHLEGFDRIPQERLLRQIYHTAHPKCTLYVNGQKLETTWSSMK